ncbi:MAG: LLM class flavin-dependent oxidoreductase [Myxococcota bacterium]|jgi:alkanesulfonate monooxygenase SsuD/methylene tetrahydromethanopterin reductase-like flavin-dependent oxidoreductase (luciferase family)|nr:LLM class flavin-dependent oxidoreductase [Myxococcota bacterium]
MRFGVFYELQLPKPWNEGDEHRLFQEALEQVVLADQLGFDYAWEVEHHFLDEYSHSSAPEVFLACAAGRTERIRLGHGIRQVIPRYNHPARTAEGIATLDLVSNGRADFGIGEGATRLELGGFGIPAKEKRAMSLEAAEQVANMMVMDPYPGFDGEYFSMPCRNVLPKPLQKPHPPMWIACTNRDTIRVAARNGLGALAFSFVDPEEAQSWSDTYYDIIRSEECVPIGHAVNANIAMVSNFSIHHDRAEAIRRGQEGFEFFNYALRALVTHDTVPGRTELWKEFQEKRGNRTEELIEASRRPDYRATGIGTPDDMRAHLSAFQEAGVDQIIFMQQSGRNRHEHICESLQLFADEVMAPFSAECEARESAKARELAPFLEAARARKKVMQPLADSEIPVVRASVKRVEVNRAGARN